MIAIPQLQLSILFFEVFFETAAIYISIAIPKPNSSFQSPFLRFSLTRLSSPMRTQINGGTFNPLF